MDEEYAEMKADLERDLENFLTLGVTENIWRHAGDLAETYSLRGFDSLHLASSLALASLDLSQAVQFSSYDTRLNDAAQQVF